VTILRVPDTLAHFADRVPQRLVSAEALARAPTVARSLTAAAGVSLECHLERAGPCSRVDVVAALTPTWGGEDIAREGAPYRNCDAWRGVRRFCRAWTDEDTDLSAIGLVGVEIDHNRPDEPYTTVCVQPGYHGRLVQDGSVAPTETALFLAKRALLHITTEPGEVKATLPAVDAAVAALPTGGALLHVALARRGPGVRLVVAIPLGCVDSYLDAIGWCGDPGVLGALRQAATFSPYVELYVEVGARGVAPELGVGTPSFGPRDGDLAAAVLDAIALSVTADAAAAGAAVSWLGQEIATVPGLHWPSLIYRRLCAKLVAREDRSLAAKVYLELYPVFDVRVGPWTREAV